MPTKPKHLPRLQRRTAYTQQTKYRKYREEIREDCQRRCVYCDIHEMEAGGTECMTLDHLRPRKQYPQLEHVPTNLVWACSPCNQLKGSDWPALGLQSDITINGKAGYIDPFKCDRKDYFEIQEDGSFKAKKVPAEYMIYSLALNRPFLRYIRRRRNLIYESLLALEQHFRAEVEMLTTVLKDENLSNTDKVSWVQEKKRFEAFLELILAFDEAFSIA